MKCLPYCFNGYYGINILGVLTCTDNCLYKYADPVLNLCV